jgi:hypothetical protein
VVLKGGVGEWLCMMSGLALLLPVSDGVLEPHYGHANKP